MKCTQCGAENQTGERCTECGALLPVEATGEAVSNAAENVTETVKETVTEQPQLKSKMAAGLLGIFLGTFGVHNFYLGYTNKAIIQVSVSVGCLLLSCCTVGISSIGTFGIGVWGFVEGIMILAGKINVDGQGNPLKE